MNKDKQPEPCDNVWCAWHVSNRPAHHAENGCTSLYSNIHREGNCELLKKWQSRPDHIGGIRELEGIILLCRTDY